MVIISSKPGQLCNRLFLSAHFIANSIHYKYKVANPSFDEFAHYFPSLRNDLFCRYSQKKTWVSYNWLRRLLYAISYRFARLGNKTSFKLPFFETIYLEWEQSLDLNSPDFIDKAKNKILFVQGWLFRDAANLNKYSKEIRLFFTLKNSYLLNTKRIISLAKKKGELIIGLHIRWGDYKKFQGGKYFYDLDTYKTVMRKTAILFQNKKIVFIIASNEKINAPDFEGWDFVLSTGREIEDLYTFAQCDYLIGPPSTYTMWASFYGNVPLYIMNSAGDHPKTPQEFKLHT